MTETPLDPAFRERLARVEGLIQEAERFRDPEARARTREIVQGILELHGAGLRRIVDRVAPVDGVLDALAHDELVSGLLLLYGLHPVDFDTRVRQAIAEVGPTVRAAGGDLELLATADGVVRVHLRAAGHGCGSTAGKLRAAVEDAILGRAPDAARVEIEGPEEKPRATFVPVEQLTLTRRTSDVVE